jgi:hypothetical protein
MRIPAALFFLSFAACATHPGYAPGGSLSGEWQGRYHYLTPVNQPPQFVDFQAKLSQNQGKLEGDISEQVQDGANGKWIAHHAILKDGTVNLVGEIGFTKQYDGLGDWDHHVIYRGVVLNGGDEIQGTWHIFENAVTETAGRFEMKRVSR